MLKSSLNASISRVFIVLAAATLVAGCAPSVHQKGLEDMRLTGELVDKVQKEGKVDLAGSDGVLCYLEMPTGSHIGRWRCDTVEGMDARANANQREMARSQAAPKAKIF
jgi:hypothetical protein